MRLLLTTIFGGIILVMTVVTIRASLDRPVWENGHLLEDPWFIATLCDAYCGFLTFFVWVAFRETSWLSRTGWFAAIMLLGNLAMATYVLMQLWRLDADQPVSQLLKPTSVQNR